MSVTVSRNFPDLRSLTLLDRADWHQIGLLQRKNIITRTQAGRAVDGSRFAPYSPEYSRRLAEEGLNPGAVDLQVSGAMLQAITVEPDDTGVTLRIR